LNELLEEKDKEGARFEVRYADDEEDNSNQDKGLVNEDVDQSTGPVVAAANASEGQKKFKEKNIDLKNKALREEFLGFSALFWYARSREHTELPVSYYLLDLIEKNNDKFDALVVFPKENKINNQIWKKRIIRDLTDKNYEKGINARYPELIKYVLVELLESREGWEGRVRKAYRDFNETVE